MNITTIGLVAGAITSSAAIPQVLRTYRTKHARDLSIWQPILLVIGMLLWLIYGVFLSDLPLILANAFSVLCYALLIFMKIYFKEDDNRRGKGYITKNKARKEEP
jgi:MtN3 and saliva related transmembrane protein